MVATLVTAPATEAIVGQPIVVTGAGWGVAVVTVTISEPESGLNLQVLLTPATGAITTVGVIALSAEVPGIWKFVATDGTSTVEADIKISAS
jgi:hypothetical protein